MREEADNAGWQRKERGNGERQVTTRYTENSRARANALRSALNETKTQRGSLMGRRKPRPGWCRRHRGRWGPCPLCLGSEKSHHRSSEVHRQAWRLPSWQSRTDSDKSPFLIEHIILQPWSQRASCGPYEGWLKELRSLNQEKLGADVTAGFKYLRARHMEEKMHSDRWREFTEKQILAQKKGHFLIIKTVTEWSG